MRPPFSYYGGKVGMSRRIVDLMPAHRVYIEPYAGSAAVLFAKPIVPHEIINDVNQALVTFWKVLRERTDELEWVCSITPHSRVEYDEAKNLDIDDELEVARRWWVRINQGFAKTADPTTGWSITTATNRSVPNTTLSRVGRFAPAVARLAGVSIECCDAVGLIQRFATGPDVLVYADPPYLATTRKGRGSGKTTDYMHDMGDEESHRRLADALWSTPANVILSGYPSPLYDALYDGWNRIEIAVTAHSSNGASTSTRYGRTEVLWTNFDPPGQTELDL